MSSFCSICSLRKCSLRKGQDAFVLRCRWSPPASVLALLALETGGIAQRLWDRWRLSLRLGTSHQIAQHKAVSLPFRPNGEK